LVIVGLLILPRFQGLGSSLYYAQAFGLAL
jgi:hypothetical protein